MTMVDACIVYKQCTQTTDIQKDFYSYIAEELIDNVYYIAVTRQASRISRGETSGYTTRNHTVVAENRIMRPGSEIHLTPTKKMRRTKGNITKHRQQRVFRDCKKYKTKHICSVCYDDNIEHWICHTDTERSCFSNHVDNDHEDL